MITRVIQVSGELDSLKRRGGTVETAARTATKWLLQAMESERQTGLLRAQVVSACSAR